VLAAGNYSVFFAERQFTDEFNNVLIDFIAKTEASPL